MTANKITNEGIVTQLAVVHTMLPKVKELIDQQTQEIEDLLEHNVKLIDDLFSERKEVIKLEAEIEALKKELALQRLSDISQEIERA
jgi:ribosomal protein S13